MESCGRTQPSVSLVPVADGDTASRASLGMEAGQTTGATPKTTRVLLPASNRGARSAHARGPARARSPLIGPGVQVPAGRDGAQECLGTVRDRVLAGP